MEDWLEKVRTGLSAHVAVFTEYGVESVEDLSLLDAEMAHAIEQRFAAAGALPLQVALLKRALKAVREEDEAARPRVIPLGQSQLYHQISTPVRGR